MYFKYSLNKLCGTLCVTQICNIIVDLPLLPKIEASVSLSVLLPLSVSDVVQGCVSWDHVWRSPWHWIQKEVGHKCHWDLRYWEAYCQCGRWLLLMYVAPSHVNACKLPSGTDCSVMFCSPDFSCLFTGKCPKPLRNRDVITLRSWLPIGKDYIIMNYSIKHAVSKDKKEC